VAALGVVVAWREHGSIEARDWLGWALVAYAVLTAGLVSGAAVRPSRRVLVGAAALFLLAAWTAFTLIWSATPSLARDEALLVTVYVVALLVPATTIRTALDRTAAAAAVVALLGAVAVATAFHLAAADSASSYLSRRLDFPVTYPNGQAAFFLVGLWPALALAARGSLPLAVRAVAVGSAAALAGGWALTQSKGGALAIAIAAIVVFSVSRDRLRLLVPTLVVGALTAAAFVWLTGPFRASSGDLVPAIRRAGDAELALIAAGLATGVVYAFADRRLDLSPRVQLTARAAASTGLVAVTAAAAAIFFARVDHPVRWADARWQSFKHLSPRGHASSHLFALGSNRYDFWRVAIHEFDDHWLSGIGARGFRAAYMQHRRSPETPARSHSLELDELSEEGIVGLSLLAVGIGFPLAACARRARSELVTAGCLGAVVGFVAHASVDWVWTFPAVGLPLFVLLGAGASRDSPVTLRPWAYGIGAAAAAAVAIVGLAPPWLSSRYVLHAEHHPDRAAADLHRARQLDPLSVDPYLAAWALAPTPTAAIAPLDQAVRKQPRVVDLWYALGRQELAAGRKDAARRTLSVALFLDPHDPVVLALYRRASR
jgi:hypothetical protein